MEETIKVNYRGIFPSKVIVVDSKSFPGSSIVSLFSSQADKRHLLIWREESGMGGGGKYLKIRSDVN